MTTLPHQSSQRSCLASRGRTLMRGRPQGISSSAFFVPTPNLQRLEFFWCSHTCMHYTKISLNCLTRISVGLCCVSLHSRSDRLLLLLRRGTRSHEHLQILAADERLNNRSTSQQDFRLNLLNIVTNSYKPKRLRGRLIFNSRKFVFQLPYFSQKSPGFHARTGNCGKNLITSKHQSKDL